jgi:hypothetical protein
VRACPKRPTKCLHEVECVCPTENLLTSSLRHFLFNPSTDDDGGPLMTMSCVDGAGCAACCLLLPPLAVRRRRPMSQPSAVRCCCCCLLLLPAAAACCSLPSPPFGCFLAAPTPRGHPSPPTTGGRVGGRASVRRELRRDEWWWRPDDGASGQGSHQPTGRKPPSVLR